MRIGNFTTLDDYPETSAPLTIYHIGVSFDNYTVKGNYNILVNGLLKINETASIGNETGCLDTTTLNFNELTNNPPILEFVNYSPDNYKIFNTRIKNISAAAGQVYEVNSCLDLGNNQGLNFTFSHPPRNFYWTGAAGQWTDFTKWSYEELDNLGVSIPLTSECDLPSSIDHVFIDEHAQFNEPIEERRIHVNEITTIKSMQINNNNYAPNLYFGPDSYGSPLIYLRILGDMLVDSDAQISGGRFFSNTHVHIEFGQGHEPSLNRRLKLPQNHSYRLRFNAPNDEFKLEAPIVDNNVVNEMPDFNPNYSYIFV